MTRKYFLSLFSIFWLGMLLLAFGVWPGFRPQTVNAYTYTESYLDYVRDIEVTGKLYARYGCPDYLAEVTSQKARDAGVEAKLVAAMVIVESSCNPDATSSMGACGLMQILKPVWSRTFPGPLYNPEYNLFAGTNILARYLKQYGLREGIKRYCGTGPDAEAYLKKVLAVYRKG